MRLSLSLALPLLATPWPSPPRPRTPLVYQASSLPADLEDYFLRFSNVARLYGADMDSTLTRLRRARVMVVGLGGVGSWVVEALARSGIGHLVLMDLDDVCVSNVNRQLPAMSSTVGKLKGEVLQHRVKDINPIANVTFIPDFLRPGNVAEVFERLGAIDYVVDCADGVTDKAAIVDHCVRNSVPIAVSGGAGGITDPSLIRVSDMARAVGDTLIMRVRKKLRQDYGYPLGMNTNSMGVKVDKKWRILVAHSLPTGSARQAQNQGQGSRKCDAIYGNSCFGTGTLGFALSSIVVNAIATDSVLIPRRLGRNISSPGPSVLMNTNVDHGQSLTACSCSNVNESTAQSTSIAPSNTNIDDSGESVPIQDIDEVKRILSSQSTEYFDSHCHLQLHTSFEEDLCSQLVQSAMSSGVRRMSVCGVCPGDDWRKVERLIDAYPQHVVPHFGLHPWWITRMTESDEESWERQLCELLDRYPNAGVGECGLDGNIRRNVDAERQMALLHKHIVIGSGYHRPITIHCVRMWGKLLEVLSSVELEGLRPRSYILHSCNSMPAEMVQSFCRLSNVYFSLAAGKFDNPKFRRLVRTIPSDKLLIETDSPDQLAVSFRGRLNSNEPSLLPYECFRLAHFQSIGHEDLARITVDNAVVAFGLDR